MKFVAAEDIEDQWEDRQIVSKESEKAEQDRSIAKQKSKGLEKVKNKTDCSRIAES